MSPTARFALLLLTWVPAISWGTQTAYSDILKSSLKHGLSEYIKSVDVGEIFRNSQSRQKLTQGCLSAVVAMVEHGIKGDFTQLLDYIDADPKPGAGIESGNYFLLGSYSECQNLPDSHYCLISYDMLLKESNYTVKLPVGVCTPLACTSQDINFVLQFIEEVILPKASLGSSGTPSVKFEGHNTHCVGGQVYSTGNIVAMVLCCFVVLLAIVCSFIDKVYLEASQGADKKYNKLENDTSIHADEIEANGRSHRSPFPRKEGRTFGKLIQCFSFYKNSAILLDTNIPNGGIGCINGIRVISMTWVIAGHCYVFAVTTAMDNSLLSFKETKLFSLLPFANGYVSVDSFFLLSGLLVTYLGLRRYEKNRRFPWIKFYVHRYLRLTPVYAFVIVLAMYIYPLFGDGPLWSLDSGLNGIGNCKTKWWTNLLYINNFYSSKEQCLAWCWYLANDMQFYIIAPLILVAIYHWKYVGLSLIVGCLLVASFVTTGLLINYYDLHTLLTADIQSLATLNYAEDYTDIVYSKPYCRLSAYLVGVVLGYILHREKDNRKPMSMIFCIIGWLVAAAVAMAVVYGPWHAYKPGGTAFTDAENIIYGTFNHFAWSLAVAWVIYCCHNYRGGLINTMLSWRCLMPVSRLTYCAYLVHPIIIEYYYSSLEEPFHYTLRAVVFLFFSFLAMSYCLAFSLAILVEYPLLALEKFALGG